MTHVTGSSAPIWPTISGIGALTVRWSCATPPPATWCSRAALCRIPKSTLIALDDKERPVISQAIQTTFRLAGLDSRQRWLVIKRTVLLVLLAEV